MGNSEATAYASRSWPAGWRGLPLSDVGKWLSGGTPSTSNDAFWGGDIPWISGASMKDFHVSDSPRRVTLLGAKNGSRLVEKGTTLFVVRGMSLKSEFRIGVAERQLAFGQDCKAVIPAEGIDPYFLAYAIRVRTPEILRMVEETSHGTGRLDTGRLQELEIGIPSLHEQGRIVAVHAAFERRVGALERECRKLRAAKKAVVAQALTEAAKNYRMVPLRDLLRKVGTGWSPVCDPTPPAIGEWGVLRLSAVTTGEFVASAAKTLPRQVAPRVAFEVKPGDVLMSRANGVKALVGVACVVKEVRPRLLLPDLVFRLVPDPDVLDSTFLGVALSSAGMRRQIDAVMRGTSGQYKISQADVRRLEIPCVPVHKQHQISEAHAVFDRRIAVLEQEKGKLRTVQQGAVEDLLSGKVRVPAL
ncbi:restriction endonuclease subunit S [Streptomyces flavidovirens]|uniref:Restriction endonuclease subunit S n=1 Tax=Streptomyces flavidovirens TaxID=67298 RepID=A0ABW6RAH3_9ACTN